MVLVNKETLHVDHTEVEVGRADTFLGSLLKVVMAHPEQLLLFLLLQEAKSTIPKIMIELFGISEACQGMTRC